jgi:hypothetical protein
MNAAMIAERGSAHLTVRNVVVLLYAMLMVNLLGSKDESVVLTKGALVLTCVLVVLCRWTRSYGLLRAGFLATCLNLLAM